MFCGLFSNLPFDEEVRWIILEKAGSICIPVGVDEN